MTEREIKEIVENQRAYFLSGRTLDLAQRRSALEKLRDCLVKYEKEIAQALYADLGKSAFESYMCETGLVLSEIRYLEKHLSAFAREKTVRTPLAQFCARSYAKPSPYGVVLIMSPWNYPLLLTLDPLADALAAGNTVILKPSAYSPATSRLLETMIAECFDRAYVAVVSGGREENRCLLQQKFDYIFFTGSQAVGKEVMTQAAQHFTPVTLELGGKSPCIVEKTANIPLAARRIVFGKYLNCGQTCVAPDYIYCDRAVQAPLLAALEKEIRLQFGDHPLENPDYGKIVNQKHFDRLLKLLDREKLAIGGETRPETLQIAPTVLKEVSFEDPVMGQEIFGPILPVIPYDDLDQAVAKLQSLPHPLALYIFTERRDLAKAVIARCGFGGGCINDVVIHLATSEMGFGGFGESGMGAYHGKAGFDIFSHRKSIVDKKTWLDLPMRYQPYRSIHEKLIRMFLR